MEKRVQFGTESNRDSPWGQAGERRKKTVKSKLAGPR